MYIIPDKVIYDPKLLVKFLRQHSISRILFTPSLFEAVLDTEGLDITESLQAMRFVRVFYKLHVPTLSVQVMRFVRVFYKLHVPTLSVCRL